MTDNTIPADWALLLNEYQRRNDQAQAMGGDAKLEKRKALGKANARELINTFVDADSFQEIGSLVAALSYHDEKPAAADALVGGLAQIDNNTVVIYAEDFTVQGGSIGHGTMAKRVRLATIALEQNLPLIMVLDGAGARMTNGLDRHPYGPNDLQILVRLKGKVPTVAVIAGSSAGHSAVGAMLMDFVIMLDDASLFSAGPPIVAAAIGEVVSKEELGGATLHTQVSGIAHNRVSNEQEAALLLTNYLNFFADKHLATYHESDQVQLLKLIPANVQTPYNIIPVINCLCDADSFVEIQPDHGKAMVTGLARLAGKSIAIVANQPMVLAGSIDDLAAEKAAAFINAVSALDIPVLFLADTPGVMSGSAAEKAGTLRSAAKMYLAQAQMQSTKLHVTLRKAFGFGSCVMAMNPFDQQLVSLALPGVSLGGLPVQGGAQAAKVTSDQAERLAAAQNSGAWAAADALAYDEVIDPRELRKRLIAALRAVEVG